MNRTEEFDIVQEWLDSHLPWDFAFKPISLGLVRQSMPALFANTVVGVQAMAAPAGLAYAMRTTFVGIFKDFAHPPEISEDLIDAISDRKLEMFSVLCFWTPSIVFYEKIFIDHINNYSKSNIWMGDEMEKYKDIFVECVFMHKLELIKQASEM